jgi:hypothetical protein
MALLFYHLAHDSKPRCSPNHALKTPWIFWKHMLNKTVKNTKNGGNYEEIQT